MPNVIVSRGNRFTGSSYDSGRFDELEGRRSEIRGFLRELSSENPNTERLLEFRDSFRSFSYISRRRIYSLAVRRISNVGWCHDCGIIWPFSANNHGLSSRSAYHDTVLCSVCADSHIMTCPGCAERFHSDEMLEHVHSNEDSEWYCPTCYRNQFFTCSSCGRAHSRSSESDASGICQECQRTPGICTECGISGSINNSGRCEHCQRGVSPFIQSYGTKAERVLSFSMIDRERIQYMGVELEVGSKKFRPRAVSELPGRDKFVICKFDGSITNSSSGGPICFGFEIVTIPATLDLHRQQWPSILNHLIQNKMLSHNTGTCGLHVHMDRKYWSVLELTKFSMFFNSKVTTKFLVEIARRDPIRWAKFLPKKGIDTYNVLLGAIQFDRYQAVNITSNTAEVRIFRGTLKYLTFMACLELPHLVIEFARHSGLADMNNFRKFLEFLTFKKKEYPELYDWCCVKGYFPKPANFSLLMPTGEDVELSNSGGNA